MFELAALSVTKTTPGAVAPPLVKAVAKGVWGELLSFLILKVQVILPLLAFKVLLKGELKADKAPEIVDVPL